MTDTNYGPGKIDRIFTRAQYSMAVNRCLYSPGFIYTAGYPVLYLPCAEYVSMASLAAPTGDYNP